MCVLSAPHRLQLDAIGVRVVSAYVWGGFWGKSVVSGIVWMVPGARPLYIKSDVRGDVRQGGHITALQDYLFLKKCYILLLVLLHDE